MIPAGLHRWLASGHVGVKVCGVTREEDAWAAVDAGVDALGFNFYSKSKRSVRLEDIERWGGALPSDVGRIAVVVQPTEELLRALLASGLFHALQFHGEETLEFCAAWGGQFYIRARGVDGAEAAAEALAENVPCLLLDAYAPGVFGGTGRVIDWSLAAQVVAQAKQTVVLSGGLTPENIAQAVRMVRPVAVDTASGVESSPGIKDAQKMRDFVKNIRQA